MTMPLSLFSRRAGLVLGFGSLVGLAGCNDSDTTAKAPEKPAASANPALEPTVNVAELMKPGDLKDEVLGKADAPVTIVEYASMTCGHCANFHTETFGHLKEKYIDTGKVRYIFREFPLDPLAFAAALLARCAGEGKFFPMIDLLFKQQRNWAYTEKPEEALLATVRQAGFTQESFNTCLQDQASYASLQKGRQRASEVFKVDSTPSFFINGRIERGAMSPAQLDKILAPHLAAATK
ncbi:MAG: DsbA family protein [Proteobacteria bacterium]|nr:DsbA family protein [Pseudomonadota bacterium]